MESHMTIEAQMNLPKRKECIINLVKRKLRVESRKLL